MKLLASLVAVAIGAAGAGPASAQARADYGKGDVCKAAGVKCVPYPRSVTVHAANCRWLEETVAKAVKSFEVCKDKDGVWRPTGRA